MGKLANNGVDVIVSLGKTSGPEQFSAEELRQLVSKTHVPTPNAGSAQLSPSGTADTGSEFASDFLMGADGEGATPKPRRSEVDVGSTFFLHKNYENFVPSQTR